MEINLDQKIKLKKSNPQNRKKIKNWKSKKMIDFIKQL